MNFPANFFYLSMGLAVWIIVGAIVFCAVEFITTLKSFQGVMADVKNSVADLELLKSSLKVGILTLISNLFGRKSKGKGGASKDD